MDKALADLIKISRTAGIDPAFVQGGGGNTSVKTDDGKFMYIKASGTALKYMSAEKGWRRVRLDAVRTIINDKILAGSETQKRETEVVNRLLLACDDDKDGSRPSVETHLHSYMDKYVIHLHPGAVGAYVNAMDGRARLERLFKDEKLPPLWVRYTDPGFLLARRIFKLTQEYKSMYKKAPQVLFLEKHGLFVTAASGAKALKLTNRIISKCNEKLKLPAAQVRKLNPLQIRRARLCLRKAFFEASGRYEMVNHFYDNRIEAFMRHRYAKKMLACGSITPDEIVYSSGAAVWIDKCEPDRISAKLKSQIAKGQKPSTAFIVKGLGLFVIGKSKNALTIRDLVVNSLFIRANALRMGGVKVLTKRERDFINKWESESFRKALTAGSVAGPLQGRIAVVTGAGSGLGRSIATGLARAGASLAIADIDTEAAEKTKKIISAEMPMAESIVTACDVTDEDGVKTAFDTVLDRFGGLDILVNAAGIAPAGALVDVDADKWRFALEVNLTGYFLMAKAAARIMIEQRIGGAIINLSSKSGLEASKDNSAYNATKAGEIHLGRGWAMELGQFGIRVNSVCPGNVFEGSKIWNPEYIRVCAKKYGIRPEQVIPYYISKTILNREIKGSDIAEAVIFLACDKSRMITGQTLVVDAGQVMVR